MTDGRLMVHGDGKTKERVHGEEGIFFKSANIKGKKGDGILIDKWYK